MKAKQRAGFTLVELSIVLVILGLLVGGVLTGQSLIRAAELRSITTQYNGYVTAVNAFKDKYFALPGDITNATAFWGIAGGTGGPLDATCKSTVGTGTATCNGNGDGQIELPNGSGVPENLRFWQHLANAGLIAGQFNGVSNVSALGAHTTNSPSGKIANSLWMPTWLGTMAAPATAYDFFDGQYGNVLEFGKSTVTSDPYTPLLKPEDMWNIDTKMDDGRPGQGRVVARYFATCANAADRTQVNADYQLGSSTVSCVAVFRQGF